MEGLNLFSQYYAEQLNIHKDDDYINLIQLRTEIYGVYKFIKKVYPESRYQLTEYFSKINEELNQLIQEKDK